MSVSVCVCRLGVGLGVCVCLSVCMSFCLRALPIFTCHIYTHTHTYTPLKMYTAFFAPEIGKLFFPKGSPTVQAVKTFTVFAGGFIMRPVGSVVLGAIGGEEYIHVCVYVCVYQKSSSVQYRLLHITHTHTHRQIRHRRRPQMVHRPHDRPHRRHRLPTHLRESGHCRPSPPHGLPPLARDECGRGIGGGHVAYQ